MVGKHPFRIAVDFDGTIVEHVYPEIGEEAPTAIQTLLALQAVGAKIMLFTMRSDGQKSGDQLSAAVDWCYKKGITFDVVNSDPEQPWSTSPKLYAHVYVDDAALGCPLVYFPPEQNRRPVVDWKKVSKRLWALKEEHDAKQD